MAGIFDDFCKVYRVTTIECGFILGDRLLKCLLDAGGMFGRLIECDYVDKVDDKADDKGYITGRKQEVVVFCNEADVSRIVSLIYEHHSDKENAVISFNEEFINKTR